MKIKDFCNIRIGHAFRERLANVPDGRARLIQPKDISPDGFISFEQGEPLRIDAPVSKRLMTKDVLVVNRGSFSAAVFDFPETEMWIVPSSVLVLSVNTQSVLPEYVVCFFNSTSGQQLLARHCEQTTVPFISAGNLGQMDIPIPSLDRQRSLAASAKAAASYAHFSRRKRELYRQILDHEIMHEVQSTRRNA